MEIVVAEAAAAGEDECEDSGGVMIGGFLCISSNMRSANILWF